MPPYKYEYSAYLYQKDRFFIKSAIRNAKNRNSFRVPAQIVEKHGFSARWWAVKKGLDAINALNGGCLRT